MENENQVNEEKPVTTPDLTVTDLANIKAIIEAAVRRGTFQANELSSVGAAYDKLEKFLVSIANQNKETK